MYRYWPDFRTGTTLACPIPAHITKGPAEFETGRFLLTIKYCRLMRNRYAITKPKIEGMVFNVFYHIRYTSSHSGAIWTSKIHFLQKSGVPFTAFNDKENCHYEGNTRFLLDLGFEGPYGSRCIGPCFWSVAQGLITFIKFDFFFFLNHEEYPFW